MSAAVLLRPLLWLLWLVLIAVVLPILLVALTPILLLVWVVGLAGMLASRDLREHMKVTWLGWLLWGLWWPILLVTAIVPTITLVVAAIVYFDGQVTAALSHTLVHLHGQLPSELRQLLPGPSLSSHDWALFCITAGIAGFSSNLVYALIDIPWRLKQIRQVRALPQSKARSAAIGLVELEGVVRATSTDGRVSRTDSQAAQPFYLEDETGRILVDPRDTAVRPRSVSGSSLQLNEIEQGIRDGDRVYVIGNVQPRDTHAPGALDSESLVIRPLKQTLVSSPVGRLLFAERHQPVDRDAPNIFIVDKGREHDVIARLRLALLDFCVFSALYLGTSLWLVQAAWPWLT